MSLPEISKSLLTPTGTPPLSSPYDTSKQVLPVKNNLALNQSVNLSQALRPVNGNSGTVNPPTASKTDWTGIPWERLVSDYHGTPQIGGVMMPDGQFVSVPGLGGLGGATGTPAEGVPGQAQAGFDFKTLIAPVAIVAVILYFIEFR